MIRFCKVVAVLAAALGLALPALAHPASMTAALFRLEPDGRFELGLDFDALAFAIDDNPDRIPQSAFDEAVHAPPAGRAAMLADALERLRRGIRIEADGSPVALEGVRLPAEGEIFRPGRRIGVPELLEATARGRLEPGRHTLRIRFPEVIGMVVVTFDLPGQEPAVEPVGGGEWAPPVQLALPRAGRLPGWLRSWSRFVGLGFRHIVPEGLDHILFVLGLFLLSTNLRSLLGQVTAFTLAHSVTLGLALYGVCRLPPRLVEPLIALSIVLIAIDNLRARQPGPCRYALVFGFGLVHGMGFAGALLDLGLTRPQLAPALAGFNIGIELGQLAVVAFAFAAVGWLRRRPAYRPAVVIPASIAIGAIALGWTVERLL